MNSAAGLAIQNLQKTQIHATGTPALGQARSHGMLALGHRTCGGRMKSWMHRLFVAICGGEMEVFKALKGDVGIEGLESIRVRLRSPPPWRTSPFPPHPPPPPPPPPPTGSVRAPLLLNGSDAHKLVTAAANARLSDWDVQTNSSKGCMNVVLPEWLIRCMMLSSDVSL